MINLKSRRLELGLTMLEVAKAIGVSEATVSRYESGNIKNMRRDRIENYAKVLQVNPALLIGADEDEKPENITGSPSESITFLDSNNICMIPLYETVSAGFGAYADDCRIGYVPMYVESRYDAENMLAIKVKGDSMYPKIEDGDTIVVRRQDVFDNGDIVVVLVDSDEGLVKKIYQDKKKVTLVSINPEYQDKVFSNAEIKRLKVVGVVKKVMKDI